MTAVCQFFARAGVTQHGYGDGISLLNSALGPNVRPAIETACGFRSASTEPRFIYVWTVDEPDLEREYVRIGADGIITDDVAKLRAIVREAELSSLVRMATRDDNPYAPTNRPTRSAFTRGTWTTPGQTRTSSSHSRGRTARRTCR